MVPMSNVNFTESPARYRIRVVGALPESWRQQLGEAELAVERLEGGGLVSAITLVVADQAALYGILWQLRDLGLPLTSLEIIL